MSRYLIALACLTGCSSDADKAATAMTEFIKACASPVKGTLTTSTYTNSVTLQCDEFKPMTAVQKGKP